MTKVSACPITVAMAAPFTPILNAKIKSGSKIRFAIAPARVQAIAYFGEASARIEAFIPCPII